jgi:hypothetical protein
MNKESYQNTLEVFTKLLNYIQELKDTYCYEIPVSTYDLESEILRIEKSLEFNIDLNGYVYSLSSIALYNTPYKTDISIGKSLEVGCPDDGLQPDVGDEWLYYIRFPTGAYTLGSSYPKDTFNRMFTELKGYNPKCIDTANHALYFDSSNAYKVHNDLNTIIKKYQEQAVIDTKAQKIQALKAQLVGLEKDVNE